MTFAQKLDQAADATQNRLQSFLDDLVEPTATSPRLAAAMRHALLGGGKRFRPFLVLESAALFGVAERAAIDTACALECVHCYSLTHDDLPAMDNDMMRRGQPTVWNAYDEWTAILAGDALLTLAFEILARDKTHAYPNIRAELVLELAKASGAIGMVGGQALDLEAEKASTTARYTCDSIRRMQSMKTGALIRFACTAGATLAAAPADDHQRLARYGDTLGLAFQIADDLLDVEGTAEETGKAVAKDAGAGKATLVSLMGLEPARRKLSELEHEAIGLMTHYGERGKTLSQAASFVVNRRS
jgi:farnesyl diphosphate synthase